MVRCPFDVIPTGLKDADRTAVRRCEVRQSLFPITKRRLRRRSADRLSFRVHSRAIDAPRTPSATNRIKPRCGAYNRKENIMSNTQPTLIAFSVKERGEGKQAIWTKIGAAFPHGTGKGLTIELDA
jgi:hypothetical protein